MSELDLRAQSSLSLWHNNPSLVQLAGLSPLLAVTDTLVKAISLGLGTLLVCVFSALFVYAFAAFISERWRFLCYSLTLAAFTSMLALAGQLFWYQLSLELGIYISLIACNFALLLRMERFHKSDSVPQVLTESLRLGSGLMLALCLLALPREALVHLQLLADWQLLLPTFDADPVQIRDREVWFRFASLAPAAFIILGLLIALCNWLGLWNPSPGQHRSDQPVKRARVSGALGRKP